MAKILVVDDEKNLVMLLKSTLSYRGHHVTGVGDGATALERFAEEAFDLVLTDLKMEPVDGLAVIDGVRERDAGVPVIVVTAYGEVSTAVEAMRRGAAHYLTKPFDNDEVALTVDRVLEEAALKRQNRALREALGRMSDHRELIGECGAMSALKELIAKVAASEATVLVRGESGSGKELVARAVHAASARAGGPFIAVNCAAITETLLESELFGYRKGAFTGAESDREGLFEAARGGTLFLDEIGEAGAAVQAKLLRVLEERKINRVGDPREREVDVRIVAATNRPLEDAIAAGAFREDLYYRLLVFPLDVPPLRDRLDDLEALAGHFLAGCGRRGRKLPAAVLKRMRAYGWPGNVRELRNLIERANILAGDEAIAAEHVLLEVGASMKTATVTGATPEDLDLQTNERRLIGIALERAGGNKSLAARMLGITRRTLYSRLKLLGIDGGGGDPSGSPEGEERT